MAGINKQVETQNEEATKKQEAINKTSDAGVDPLDAFMAGIDAELNQQKSSSGKTSKTAFVPEHMDADDGVDEMQAQLNALREYGGHISANATSKEMKQAEREAERASTSRKGRWQVKYDSDGNAIVPNEKEVPTLLALDHSTIRYEPFEKKFYSQHPDVDRLSQDEVAAFRSKHSIKVSGGTAGAKIRPISSFDQAGFESLLRKRIESVGYTTPTPIQCQVLPVIMSGHDVIGIAKTGSGKTLAFVWPVLVHCIAQRELEVC